MNHSISILGCGWLGFPLGKALLNEEYHVQGSTTTESKIPLLAASGIHPFLVDVKNIKENIKFFLDVEILVIAIIKQDVHFFQNLIEQIETSSVKKVLFISSTSVYENNNQTVTEDEPTKDCLLRKLETLFTKNEHFETTILRFGGLFGYERKPGNFVKADHLMSNPEGFINLIHQDDCIAIIKEILRKNIWNQTLHASADTHPKRREFYTKEALKLGKQEPLFNEHSENKYKVIDSTKIKDLLGYEFKYSDLMAY
ncbi:MAG: NAD(P)H-binding protein [Reichenbachiella sp.]